MQDAGIDVEDERLMTSRTWRWLRTRVIGLLAVDSRLSRSLAPPPQLQT